MAVVGKVDIWSTQQRYSVIYADRRGVMCKADGGGGKKALCDNDGGRNRKFTSEKAC